MTAPTFSTHHLHPNRSEQIGASVEFRPARTPASTRDLFHFKLHCANTTVTAVLSSTQLSDFRRQLSIAAVKAMSDAFTHDGSDIMTDDFDVRFYCTPTVDWQAATAEWDAILKEPTMIQPA